MARLFYGNTAVVKYYKNWHCICIVFLQYGDVDPLAVLGVFLVKTALRKYALAAHYVPCAVE